MFFDIRIRFYSLLHRHIKALHTFLHFCNFSHTPIWHHFIPSHFRTHIVTDVVKFWETIITWIFSWVTFRSCIIFPMNWWTMTQSSVHICYYLFTYINISMDVNVKYAFLHINWSDMLDTEFNIIFYSNEEVIISKK